MRLKGHAVDKTYNKCIYEVTWNEEVTEETQVEMRE
jgi:hypothetical protein